MPGSFGSIFQSIGLCHVLEAMKYSSNIAQIASLPQKYYPNTIKKITLNNIRILMQKSIVYTKLQKKYSNTCTFIKSNLNLSYYKNLNDLRNRTVDGEIFLAGSDQIWHPVKMAPEFFLDYVDDSKKKISYAASMGTTVIPENNIEKFTKYINSFDKISVREKQCAEVISELTDKPVQVHIDPSFFMNAEQWREYQKEYPINKPYILVYPLYWDSKYNMELKELHKKTGFDIVVIADYRRNVYANKWVYDADPGQFLWLIDHAEAVVSSSFHGVALSINFNKKVVSVINPSAPSRIDNLLEVLGYPKLDIESVEKTTIDYKLINERIENERCRGINYLKEALDSNA